MEGTLWIDPSALFVSGGPCAEEPLLIEASQRLLMNATVLMTKYSFLSVKLYRAKINSLQI